MIDSKFHVELNGKKYTLAEDAEGTHYQRRREPLRAPTNGFVLGDTNKFNLRPDLLEWNMTDWSGGEGYRVFDSENPNGYLVGWDIDPSTPGELRLAKRWDVTQDSTGAADFDEHGTAAKFVASLAFVLNTQGGVDGYHVWDDTNIKWGAIDTIAGQDLGMNLGAKSVTTPAHIYFGGDNTGGDFDIFRVKSDLSEVQFATISDHVNWDMAGPVNSFMYIAGEDVDLIWEVRELDLTAAPLVVTSTQVLQLFPNTLQDLRFWPELIAADNRVFFSLYTSNSTSTIYQITPTSAAGAGFGEEVFRIPGFSIETMFYAFGLLFALGVRENKTNIFYYDPVNQTPGLLWEAPDERAFEHFSSAHKTMGSATSEGQQGFITHFIHASGPSMDMSEITLMSANAINGAVWGGPTWQPSTPAGGFPHIRLLPWNGVTVFDGRPFATVSYLTSGPTIQTRVLRLSDDYVTAKAGIVQSAVNDFGIVDEKVLGSFSVSLEALPAGNTVVVKYQLDQDGVWLTAGTVSTTGATEATFIVSDGSTTRRFRNLQTRLELDSDNGAETPVVRSLRARATVVKGVRTWSLLLNATDELGAMQNRSWNGATLIDNITDAADMDAVVTFKDGYSDRKAGGYTEYDVVIDDYTVSNDRPGEGTVLVSLREVV